MKSQLQPHFVAQLVTQSHIARQTEHTGKHNHLSTLCDPMFVSACDATCCWPSLTILRAERLGYSIPTRISGTLTTGSITADSTALSHFTKLKHIQTAPMINHDVTHKPAPKPIHIEPIGTGKTKPNRFSVTG